MKIPRHIETRTHPPRVSLHVIHCYTVVERVATDPFLTRRVATCDDHLVDLLSWLSNHGKSSFSPAFRAVSFLHRFQRYCCVNDPGSGPRKLEDQSSTDLEALRILNPVDLHNLTLSLLATSPDLKKFLNMSSEADVLLLREL